MIVTKELPDESYILLRALTRNIDAGETKSIVNEMAKLPEGSGAENTARYATTTVGADNMTESGSQSGKYTSGDVAVENQTGTVLPSNGDIGTTVLYIVDGAFL